MKYMKYILSIDQGTTGTTVMLLDKALRVKSKVNNEFKQYYPEPGWVEHDPEEIWAGTLKTIDQALKKSRVEGSDIAGIGITNQRETTVLWDKESGRPVHRAIVWQDRRTAAFCESLREKGLLPVVKEKTGLVLDPYFSATKIRWILSHIKQAEQLALKGRLAFGTIDSYLVYKLTGGTVHVTDVTNASRTLLMSLKALAWDDELLKIFDIPKDILPEIRSCAEVYGVTRGCGVLPDGIPVAGMAGDQQAALFGQACFKAGEAKCTYGTGSFLLMNIGERPVLSESGLLTTVAWKLGDTVNYALEGSVFVAGAVVQWLRDELKIISQASEIEKLAKTVTDNGGVHFVPALAGLGAPYWDPHARGMITGLTRGSNRGHIARAALEGIAFSQYDVLSAMQRDSGHKLKTLKVDGGACANNLLMQFQSDILGCEIIRPMIIETTAMGAAFLAGLGSGLWQDQNEISKGLKVDKKFGPKMSDASRKSQTDHWQRAVARVRA
ncbi:MAG: glycerol kinase GlpK [Deltaproteobacteria bacterium]|nr:glycerol kinase GlpK [Deltaproteobacteria bacterium]